LGPKQKKTYETQRNDRRRRDSCQTGTQATRVNITAIVSGQTIRVTGRVESNGKVEENKNLRWQTREGDLNQSKTRNGRENYKSRGGGLTQIGKTPGRGKGGKNWCSGAKGKKLKGGIIDDIIDELRRLSDTVRGTCCVARIFGQGVASPEKEGRKKKEGKGGDKFDDSRELYLLSGEKGINRGRRICQAITAKWLMEV